MSGMGSRVSCERREAVSKLRSRLRRRGPACGLRPVYRASIWYCGLPAIAPAATGEGEAAAAGEAAGLAAGEAAGEAPATGDAAGAVAGETDATGAIAG